MTYRALIRSTVDRGYGPVSIFEDRGTVVAKDRDSAVQELIARGWTEGQAVILIPDDQLVEQKL